MRILAGFDLTRSARNCIGYQGDIGIPPVPHPMDFSAWFEGWFGGRWYTFNARHNTPRIGRILIATGRDATDVAISTSYRTATLAHVSVVTDEIVEARTVPTRMAGYRLSGMLGRLLGPVDSLEAKVGPGASKKNA